MSEINHRRWVLYFSSCLVAARAEGSEDAGMIWCSYRKGEVDGIRKGEGGCKLLEGEMGEIVGILCRVKR